MPRAPHNSDLLDEFARVVAQRAVAEAKYDSPSAPYDKEEYLLRQQVLQRMVEPPYVPPPCVHCGQARDAHFYGVTQSKHRSRGYWSCRNGKGTEYAPQEEPA